MAEKPTFEDVRKSFNEVLTPRDFARVFTLILNSIQARWNELQSMFDAIAKAMSEEFNAFRKKHQEETDTKLGKMSGRIADIAKVVRETRTRVLGEVDQRIANIKDPDEEAIASRILEQVPPSLTLEEVRAAISGWPDEVLLALKAIGPEKLREAIGIDDFIARLREELVGMLNTRGRQGVQVGLTRDVVRFYDLSDQLDGATKTFKLPAFKRIIAVQSSSFPMAFRPTTDYTWDAADPSITFTAEIDAASTLATGQTLGVIYA